MVDGRLLRRVVPFQSLRTLGALNADVLAASTNQKKGKKGGKKWGKNNNTATAASTSSSSADEPPLAVGTEVVARFGNRPGGRFYSGKVIGARRLTLFEVMFECLLYNDNAPISILLSSKYLVETILLEPVE